MKIKLISDLHYNLIRDNSEGANTSKLLSEGDYDVLVVAGDLSTQKDYGYHLKILANYVSKPIIIVGGNHDYWGSQSHSQAIDIMKEACAKHNHVHFLENESVVIGDQRFIGSTLWFDYKPTSYDRKWSDLRYAPYLTEEVRHINQQSIEYFLNEVKSNDIVVTHHLPTQKSIHNDYANDEYNKFYYSGCDFLIKSNEPKFWFHGHTHKPCDHQLYNTRIVCNPLGYYFERSCNYTSGQLIEA